MPTYEYKCDTCAHQFETFQSIKDDPLETCPSCGGTIKRLIGGGNGFIFKGSGFYITDYARKGKTASAPGATPPKETISKKEKKAASETSKET